MPELTDHEKKVAAECARNYPIGKGRYFLALPPEIPFGPTDNPSGTERVLNYHPEYVKFG